MSIDEKNDPDAVDVPDVDEEQVTDDADLDAGADDAGEEDAPDYEAEARAMGWTPESEWKGRKPPGGVMGAEEFVRAGRVSKAVLRDENAAKDAEIAGLKKRLDAFEGWQDRVTKSVTKTERARYDKELADLKANQRAAAEDGDMDRFDELAKQEGEMEAPAEDLDTEETKADGQSPVLARWQSQNPWFGSNREMTAYAEGMASVLRGENPNAPEAEFYNLVKDAVVAQFPGKFRRTSPARSPVESGGRSTRGNGKSWSSIPLADRNAARQAGYFGDGGMYPDTAEGHASYAEGYFMQEGT